MACAGKVISITWGIRSLMGFLLLVTGSGGWGATASWAAWQNPAENRAARETGVVRVVVLAGQSNMEGQAVVALRGRDYNEGQGNLVSVLAHPELGPKVAKLITPEGQGRPRSDVFVRYQRENQPLLAGPLDVGFSVYGGQQHFGPELQFGHVVGDACEDPVLLIKTAWGGKSLAQDFRPPSSGGQTGHYYQLMLEQVRDGLQNLGQDFPSLKSRRPVLSGFVWYHGWNDGCDPQHAIPEYEENLVHLIQDVRREWQAPELPVVVGELTGPWRDAPPEWERLRAAQRAATLRPEVSRRTLFVPTRDFVRPAEKSPNPTHGHHEFGNAETYFLVGDALGQGMVELWKQANAKN